VVAAARCEGPWEVLSDAYSMWLDFDVLRGVAFTLMVLDRLVEPASKLAMIGILKDLEIAAQHRNTPGAALNRCQARDYRDALAKACRGPFRAHHGQCPRSCMT
jgi:hypothetical protein